MMFLFFFSIPVRNVYMCVRSYKEYCTYTYILLHVATCNAFAIYTVIHTNYGTQGRNFWTICRIVYFVNDFRSNDNNKVSQNNFHWICKDYIFFVFSFTHFFTCFCYLFFNYLKIIEISFVMYTRLFSYICMYIYKYMYMFVCIHIYRYLRFRKQQYNKAKSFVSFLFKYIYIYFLFKIISRLFAFVSFGFLSM